MRHQPISAKRRLARPFTVAGYLIVTRCIRDARALRVFTVALATLLEVRPEIEVIGVQTEFYPSMYCRIGGQQLPSAGDTMSIAGFSSMRIG